MPDEPKTKEDAVALLGSALGLHPPPVGILVGTEVWMRAVEPWMRTYARSNSGSQLGSHTYYQGMPVYVSDEVPPNAVVRLYRGKDAGRLALRRDEEEEEGADDDDDRES
jgi:hypothetical protein